MCLAIPGKIISINGEGPMFRMGKVSFGGIIKEVSLAFEPEALIGNYVLVHAGFAISIIDENEAEQVFEYLRQIDELGVAEDNKP